MTAITAITAQNTVGVTAIHAIPPDIIIAQVKAVADESASTRSRSGCSATGGRSRRSRGRSASCQKRTPVVLDPVMVAESGAVLLDPEARQALIEELLPRATVLTPNVPEARALAGGRADGEDTNDPDIEASPGVSTRSDHARSS